MGLNIDILITCNYIYMTKYRGKQNDNKQSDDDDIYNEQIQKKEKNIFIQTDKIG